MNRVKPWVAGSTIALVAVVASAYFITSPPVYGFCVACHTRDLVTGTAPLFTGVGLLIGAFFGARRHGEFRFRKPVRLLSRFVLGMTAMVASLVALGCTVRLLLRAAYGESTAWWAVGGVALGIALATYALRLYARRGLE